MKRIAKPSVHHVPEGIVTAPAEEMLQASSGAPILIRSRRRRTLIAALGIDIAMRRKS